MTYSMFKVQNDRAKVALSYQKGLRITKVQLQNDAVLLSNGSMTTIPVLVNYIMTGQGFVTNPSAISRWTHFDKR